MKNYLNYSLLLVLLLVLGGGCASDDDGDMDPIVGDYNYTMHVKPIIDANCLACHGNPATNGAPMSVTTYSEVKTAVENRNLINRIENGDMPPGGSLNPGQIKTIKDWATGGFKE